MHKQLFISSGWKYTIVSLSFADFVLLLCVTFKGVGDYRFIHPRGCQATFMWFIQPPPLRKSGKRTHYTNTNEATRHMLFTNAGERNKHTEGLGLGQHCTRRERQHDKDNMSRKERERDNRHSESPGLFLSRLAQGAGGQEWERGPNTQLLVQHTVFEWKEMTKRTRESGRHVFYTKHTRLKKSCQQKNTEVIEHRTTES